jgi:hypothetical protein
LVVVEVQGFLESRLDGLRQLSGEGRQKQAVIDSVKHCFMLCFLYSMWTGIWGCRD